LGTLTRREYPYLTGKYKAKVADEDVKDAIRTEDRNMEIKVHTCPLEGVDNGETLRMDMRENPERAGFPRGDSRRV
jgi:hypothetical protein